MLNILRSLPPGFLHSTARDLHRILPGPTLVHLEGRRTPALFVSILLHGNEDVGLQAIQLLLRHYRDRPLPRALSLFIGNVAAAERGVRRLPGQPDYNRAWPGGEEEGSTEHALLSQVVEEMRQRGVFASIDLHNNTGLNPHYACINRLDPPFLHLATLFSRTVVYFIRPTGVQSMAFAPLCPAVTVECGRVGDAHGIEHAHRYLESCLHIAELPRHPIAARDIDLFHTVATVTIPAGIRFGFGDPAADLDLREDIERLNFSELAAGTPFATARRNDRPVLEVRDEQGKERSDHFLIRHGQQILLRRPVMPAMLTRDKRVIQQDCLCYFMERYPLPQHRESSHLATG